MKFEELTESKLIPNETLWRYLDLHKFISFITSKELFFTRLDLFQDPFEGVTTRLIKQRYMARLLPQFENFNPRLPENVIENLTLEKKLTEQKYDAESIKKQKTQFVNCWFRGERESLAMWNLYSNKDSIVLKIEGRSLIEFLKSYLKNNPSFYPSFEFICGAVRYFKLNPVDLQEIISGIKYSAFKKDVAFNFENEYRLLIATPEQDFESNPSFLRIKLEDSFFENFDVICHPEMTDWKLNNIISICQKTNFNRIIKSQIELK